MMEEIKSLLDLSNIIDILSSLFSRIIDGLMEFLPNSPFQALLQGMNSLPYLPILNWLFPISEIAYVTGLWLGAIAIYYVYSALLRFVRAIK